MQKLLSFMLVNTVIFMANLSYAKDHVLTNITVQGEKRMLKLILVVDENSDIEKFKVAEFIDEKLTSQDVYGVEGAQEGIVLLEEKGRKIVRLTSQNFSAHQGGDVEMDYLYNGITGSRSSLEVDLQRDGDDWSMYIDGQKVKKLHFVKNKKAFVGVVGIKRVIVN